jgi:glutaredoxin-like YruB-family protein
MEKGKIKVKVYSTPTCPYCAMAKDFLNKHGVDFEDIDVASDRDAATYIVEKSGQMGVPIIEIDDEIIVGFDRDAISKALKIKD